MANDIVRFATGLETNLSSEPKEKGKVLFAITGDNKGYIYFDKDNNTRIKMSEHATTAEKDVTNNPITSYIRGVNLNKATGIWTFSKGTNETIAIDNSNYPTQLLARPQKLNGVNDITLQALFSSVRANRLAFLPASQIIIESTTDGGTTWVDAGVSDDVKAKLFAEQRPTVSIPKINNVKNINCGLRITFTAMRYNVPEGTPETQKYNYWSSQYVLSQERYCNLKEFYFWLGSNSDGIQIKVERATGANPNNWSVIFEDTSWAATGWSGNDYVRFGQSTFGGGTNQTGNYWNYRITFFTRNNQGGTTLSTSSTTSAQGIYEIRGYGDTWWGRPNNYMAEDHLYTFDVNKNATFPANLTATNFIGHLQGNADTATKATGDSAGNNITESYVKYGSIGISDTNHKFTYTNYNNQTTELSLPFVKLSGDTMTGDLLVNKSSGDSRVSVNNGKKVSLLASTNRGLYDDTNSKWIIYRIAAGTDTRIVSGTEGKEWIFKNDGTFNTPGGATATANMIGTATRAIGDSKGSAITTTYATVGNFTTDATNHKVVYKDNNNTSYEFSMPFVKLDGDAMTGNLSTSGSITATGGFVGDLTGNASSASTLLHKTLNDTTLNNTAGSFAFSGSGVPWNGTDWVGLQIGDSVDKFQIVADGNTLLFRQNDNGGTNTSWNAWKRFPYIPYNTAKGSITKPIWIDTTGEVKECTYELKATINSATQWGVAYYSTTTNLTSTAAGAANTALMGKGSAAPAFVSVNPTLTLTSGSTSGPKVKITVLGVAGTDLELPSATADASGVVTTGSQVFNGVKTFNSAGDSSHSTFDNASIVTMGGISVAKQLSAKTIRIDNGQTSEGAILQYNESLDTLNFVFV